MPLAPQQIQEKRKYCRMDTVFPVDIVLQDFETTAGPKVHHLQGFTRDISDGGVGISYKATNMAAIRLLDQKEPILDLYIEPFFRKKPIYAKARIAWIKKEPSTDYPQYFIGAEYLEIERQDAKALNFYASARKWMPRLVLLLIGSLGISIVSLVWSQETLIKQNQDLVAQLVHLAQSRDSVVQKLDLLLTEENKLRRQLEAARKEGQNEAQITQLEASMHQIQLQKEDEFGGIRESQSDDWKLDKRIPQQFYLWLLNHQYPATGLIPSYEGDSNLHETSYLYDQALSAIAFLVMNNREAAQKILNFFNIEAKRQEGAFVSAYDTKTGEPAEWNVSVGPNVWLGIAALQYEKQTGDASFRELAKDLGEWTLALQTQDPERGIKGGPHVKWFSTEHNLDAYAFFIMLHEITREPSLHAFANTH